MKCDELQRHSIRGVMFNGEEICGGFAYYDSDEVDEAIAELKAQLESEKASRYAESVDAGMRERRLKRVLWLTRAERARTDSIYWLNLMYDEKWSSVKFTVRRKYGANVKPRQTTRTPEKWFNVWDVVELYCKHKYKEYK